MSNEDEFRSSVTAWIHDLKKGDDDAAQKIWDRYFQRLSKLAARKLGNASKRIADEEDVAVDVFHSLCTGAAAGRFDRLGNRDDLWKLLVAISGMKAVDQIRRQTSQKRGGGEVRGHSIVAGGMHEGQLAGFDRFIDSEPTPEFLSLMEEQRARLFDMLRDDTQREVARLRFEGFANQEIADKLGIALRSVERKLKVIRETWSTVLDGAEI
ncbi:MAG: ECF-type sigma factor [Planctomycetota bacterium]